MEQRRQRPTTAYMKLFFCRLEITIRGGGEGWREKQGNDVPQKRGSKAFPKLEALEEKWCYTYK